MAMRLTDVLMTAVLACAASAALAQSSSPSASQNVHWHISVLLDDQQIDEFADTTAIGQASNVTHHHPTVHQVGCNAQPAASVDLSRTVEVSPLTVDPAGTATLSIDTRQTLEDAAPTQTPEGCSLPPQPRLLNARHPGLAVPTGQASDWVLLKAKPKLVYRVSTTPGQ